MRQVSMQNPLQERAKYSSPPAGMQLPTYPNHGLAQAPQVSRGSANPRRSSRAGGENIIAQNPTRSHSILLFLAAKSASTNNLRGSSRHTNNSITRSKYDCRARDHLNDARQEGACTAREEEARRGGGGEGRKGGREAHTQGGQEEGAARGRRKKGYR